MIGWVANAFLIAGLYWLSPRRRWPFAATAVGEAIWLAESVRIARWDMASLCVVFAALAVRNLIRWRPA